MIDNMPTPRRIAFMESGAAQLKDWMRRRGFNQADACRFLGFDQASMSNFCAGKRTPGLETAIHLERLTGIPVEAWLPTALGTTEIVTAEQASKSSR
jgi:transcriptional regulator with XRE-family HTH domain